MEKSIRLEFEDHAEFCRESIGVYRDCQTQKLDGERFSARFCFALENALTSAWHCEVTLMQSGEGGEPKVENLSEKIHIFCTEKENQLLIDSLPLAPKGGAFELLLRPYAVGTDGICRYGLTEVFYYGCASDTEGNPVFSKANRDSCLVVASDDTFIFNKNSEEPELKFGAVELLQVRNTGDENTDLYRAAYFKFVLRAESVRLLQTVASAKLCLFVNRLEKNTTRKYYNMTVHATDTAWSESDLTYQNHRELAATKELIAKDIHCESGGFRVDVLDYLKKQSPKADGTIEVSFLVSCEGHEDAIVIYLNSKENAYCKPTIELGYYNSLYYNPQMRGNQGYEPWGYAKMLVDEWFDELVDQIYPKDASGNVIYHDEYGVFAPEGYGATEPTGDFTKEVKWKFGTVWSKDAEFGYRVPESDWTMARYARTVSTLGESSKCRFLDSRLAKEVSEYDIYGGIANAAVKGKATGFFHTEKHGGRFYIIDPLGNPYFAWGMNAIDLGATDNQKRYTLARYKNEAAYFEQMTRSLQSIGVNLSAVSAEAELMQVENGLPCLVSMNIVSEYMAKIGCGKQSGLGYPYNSTMNVFDPDFVKEARAIVAAKIRAGGYAENPLVLGYTTDNELPSGNDILTRYLTLDPQSAPVNSFSYAVAWTWLARRMETPSPTLTDYSLSPECAQMNSEFLCFIYSRYYRVSREAIEAVDPNHMYLGSRINGTCYTDEGYHRAAGRYLDILSINLYKGLNPDAKMITDFYRNSGKPFMVTEFFAKGMDAIDANGFKLANSAGGGILVYTQQQRADYYEHCALSMLETKACVGLIWYRFRDNDQGLYRQKGTNNTMYMCHVSYRQKKSPNTFMDEGGRILTAAEVGEYETIYKGEKIASNQNINKGIYNSTFASVVTVYTYGLNGNLLDSMSYEVETPENDHPAEGTVLKALKNDAIYTVGEIQNDDGTVARTVLTTFEGRYIAFSEAIKSVSDHVMGLVRYFDEK